MFFRFILHAKKTAFVVEHDFIMATYLADRVIVFEGDPGCGVFSLYFLSLSSSPQALSEQQKLRCLCSVECTARAPSSLVQGMNIFLQSLGITFRRDPTNFRPRINKLESCKDKEQKLAGNYFMIDDN